MSKAILRKTDTKVSLKLYCETTETLSETITLATDLLDSSREALAGGSNVPKANIISLWWAGASGVVITIKRGTPATTIATLHCDSPGSFDFEDVHFVDNIQNSENVVITASGAGAAQLYVTMRKVAGYLSKIETPAYGSYDDETVIGARTDVTGSPDYTP